MEAVIDLRRALQDLGSDLIIRLGNTSGELSALAQQVQARNIITEQEIDHEWRDLLSSLSADSKEGQVQNVECWTAPLYEIERKQLPSSYREFQRMRCPEIPPLPAPVSLPALPKNLHKGDVPGVPAIKEHVKQMFSNNTWHTSFKKLQNNAAEAILNTVNEESRVITLPGRREYRGLVKDILAWREKYILANPHEGLDRRRKELVMKSDGKDEIESHRAAASTALPALDGYLRFFEPTWRDDWQKIHQEILDLEGREARKGASFRLLFGHALALGSISRRTVYYKALEYEKARNGGRSSPFGFSTLTAAAAIQDMKSIEWYQMLATVSEEDGGKKGWQVQTWCWRGFLIQYSVMGTHGPPIVLVHGFGAFWEHYRDNIRGLSDKGNRVWALTLLGFGRSEKPNVAYTELLWAELIRDFIVEVVGEPAILVGNSIGGYLVSIAAGLWPQIVSTLILLNTAGAVVPDYLSLRYLKPRGKSGVTWAAARLLLLYLRGISHRLMKNVYPVKPWRADDWLAGEVIRASFDPGAVILLECMFRLRKPLPINWFIDRYTGRVYVIQGVKDPLNKAIQRAQLLKDHCNNVMVELLDAGHCPHDELPEEVNRLISDWIQKSDLLRGNPASLSHIG